MTIFLTRQKKHVDKGSSSVHARAHTHTHRAICDLDQMWELHSISGWWHPSLSKEIKAQNTVQLTLRTHLFFICSHKCTQLHRWFFPQKKNIRKKDNWWKIVFWFKALRNGSGQSISCPDLCFVQTARELSPLGPLHPSGEQGWLRKREKSKGRSAHWANLGLWLRFTKIYFSSYLYKRPLPTLQYQS